MTVDTHCHLTYPELHGQIDQVLHRSTSAGVHRWITVGTDKEHWYAAVSLADRFAGIHVALGLHPHYAAAASAQDLQLLEQMVSDNPKVCAIGETGLDLHYPDVPQADQVRLFAWHLDLAARLGKPLVVHCRDAFEQTLGLIAQRAGRLGAVVLHCFTGTVQQAQKALELGLYLSFSGIVTFKQSGYLRTALRQVPPDRLLVETDCPYLSPEPVRSRRINEPAHLTYTIDAMAQARSCCPAELAEVLAQNAQQVFGLPGTRLS